MSSPVFYAPSSDPEMQAAYEGAQSTFKYLWRELTWEYRRIIPSLEMSAVKAAFLDPGRHEDDTEHMWLGDIGFNGDHIVATLLNRPNKLTSVKEGDRITLRPDQIEDWMYAVNGVVFGGFTIQAIRRHMVDAERAAHDAAWGFDFGDPGFVRHAPKWGSDDPDQEHPMSVNMRAKLVEAIAQQRDAVLFRTDPDGLTTLHLMALGGSADAVEVLLEAGADRHTKTKSGKTALQLAEQMGWPRCVALLR